MAVLALISPGAMGAAVAACTRADIEVRWAGEERSAATRERAEAAGLIDAGDLDALVSGADAVLSICPPAEARRVADEVAVTGFSGLYVDANAVAPATAENIRHAVAPADHVDAGIIGPPPTGPGTTRLHLSGERAEEVAAWFDGSALDARVVAGSPVAASALKVAFAGVSKGTTALLLTAVAAARAHGVEDALMEEWAGTDLPGRLERGAAGSVPKAWRFAGEMQEIADALAAAGLPEGFHRAAADVYGRLAGFKDVEAPELDAVVTTLLGDDRVT